jgi:hypothetical protein
MQSALGAGDAAFCSMRLKAALNGIRRSELLNEDDLVAMSASCIVPGLVSKSSPLGNLPAKHSQDGIPA